MLDRELIRPGAEGATTDLVLKEGGGSLRAAAPLLWEGLGDGAIIVGPMIFVVGMAGAIVLDFPGSLFPGATGLFLVLWGAVAEFLGLVVCAYPWQVRRVQFRPADGPTELRVVRGAWAGRWRPVSLLRRVDLVTWAEVSDENSPRLLSRYDRGEWAEVPDDDPEQRTVELSVAVLVGRRTRGSAFAPPGTDPQETRRTLEELLGPAGVPVSLVTRPSVVRRRESGWTYGGSGPVGSGGG